MRRAIILPICSLVLVAGLLAQTAVNVPRPEQKAKQQRAVSKQQEKHAQRTSTIEFQGQQAFKDKELRSQLKEQITTIDAHGLTAARADDLAFFLEVFYRKHGYAKVKAKYVLESANRVRLEIDEGPLMTLRTVTFDGNVNQPTERLFEFAVEPTRERYSRLQKKLPFVAADIEEGADLVHRLYVARGFLDAVVDAPQYTFHNDTNQVDALIPIHEGRQYFFGDVAFTGKAIYDPATLRGQVVDLLKQPYTDARLADIPRRLQAYYKARGYYDVKVEAVGDPTVADDGRVPVQITVTAGPLYHFDDVTVSGLDRLRPSFVRKRFSNLKGKTYSPDVLDERFRTLMRTGLFSILQIKPTPVDGNLLRLDITAEEAKSKEVGFSVGYGTWQGGIAGVSYRDRDLFGYGRPLSTSIEISQRGYKGEIAYEDPFFLETDLDFKARVGAYTFDFDGYSKFETGGRIELSRKITKQYEVGVVFSVRHVEVTSASIDKMFLGQTVYFANSLGFSQTLDFRDSPLVSPRGFVFSQTLDFDLNAFGSDVELVRGTFRAGYYLPFGPKPLAPGVVEDRVDTPLQRWVQQSSLAFGARMGIIHSLSTSGHAEANELPIDERFFNGGATTVRSFGERKLGPLDPRGNPIGGEFFTVFNIEYTFPIIGELQGALFTDAGNLLPTSEKPGLDDLRYAIGVGLRYKLPIGPIRLDYGFNPDPHAHEDMGAFHFSFGFAF